jgi:membrane fusion protein (multidrug efflux system)
VDTREQAPVTRGDVPVEESAEVTTSKRNVRPFLIAAAVVVAILVVIFGLRWYSYARVHQSTDDARVDANTVSITSKISERVDKILVDTDQRVHKGQLLVVLDSAAERAALDQARANLELAMQNRLAGVQQGSGAVNQAQAEVQGAAAQVPLAQAGVSAAQAQVQAAQAALPGASQALTRARADYQRTLSLVNTGDLPRQQLDAARAAYAAAQSQHAAAQDNVNVAIANMNAAQQRISSAQAGVSAAQGGVQTAQGKLSAVQSPASVAAAQATVAIALQNLTNTRISSSIEGSVGEKHVEVGQTVSAGMPLLTLIPNSTFITANYKETQVGDMHPGQPVDIHIDAYKGVTFHGRVVAINPASQNTYALVPSQNSTGNFVKVTQRIPVKISIDDADPQKYPMRPGMSVETAVQVH